MEKIQAKAKNAYPDGSNYFETYLAEREAFIAGANEVIQHPQEYISGLSNSEPQIEDYPITDKGFDEFEEDYLKCDEEIEKIAKKWSTEWGAAHPAP